VDVACPQCGRLIGADGCVRCDDDRRRVSPRFVRPFIQPSAPDRAPDPAPPLASLPENPSPQATAAAAIRPPGARPLTRRSVDTPAALPPPEPSEPSDDEPGEAAGALDLPASEPAAEAGRRPGRVLLAALGVAGCVVALVLGMSMQSDGASPPSTPGNDFYRPETGGGRAADQSPGVGATASATPHPPGSSRDSGTPDRTPPPPPPGGGPGQPSASSASDSSPSAGVPSTSGPFGGWPSNGPRPSASGTWGPWGGGPWGGGR
jgi:hypothetical protein